MVMSVYTPLALHGGMSLGQDLADFPIDPRMNQMEVVDGVLWVYTTIQGVSTWSPLNNRKNNFVHTQGVVSDYWIVNHGLNSTDIIIVVYDAQGTLMVVNHTVIDANRVELQLTEATTGRAVVFADTEAYVPAIQTQALNTQTAVIGGNVTITAGSIDVAGRQVAITDALGRIDAQLLGGLAASQYMTEAQTNDAIQAVVGAAPAALDTLEEIAAQLGAGDSVTASIINTLAEKVDASTLGAPDGVATLDQDGIVNITQLPPALLVAANSFGLMTGAMGVATDPGTVVVLDDSGRVPVEQLPAGTADGLATLDSTGKLAAAQLPTVTYGDV